MTVSAPPQNTTAAPATSADQGTILAKDPTTGLATLTFTRRDKEIETSAKPLSLSMYKRMFQYTRDYKWFLYPLLIIVVMRAIQLPLLSKSVALIINGPISNGSLVTLAWALGGYFFFTAFTQYMLFHRSRLAQLLGEGVVHDLRRDIFDHLQTMTMGFFHKTRLGRIISRVTSDSEAVRAGVQDAVFVSIVNLGQIGMALILMGFADVPLFAVVLATTPGYFLLHRYFRKRLIQAHRANQESFSRVTANLAESVNGIRITQSFVRQDINAQLWHELVKSHAQYNLRTVKASGVFQPSLELLNTCVLAAVILIGGYRILLCGADVKNLIVVFMLIGDVMGPVGALARNYTTAVASMSGAERIFHMLDRKPDFVDPPEAVVLPRIEGRVEFRGLSFEYEPNKPVLKNINLVIEPGQTVALVGHTGSGKTSIINLISKFYLPTVGELFIDGQEIRTIQSDSLHRQMGIVLQQNFLFTGTVIDNIRLGMPGATDEAVREAVKKLDCLDMIENLAQGFDTVVGERGAGLSLGERQLICFARAMLADPRIMILDEATSSVDTLTEMRLQQALAKLLKGRTSFVVAHRLSTIRNADLILVLDHGVIVEQGRHDLLLASNGVYAQLYKQFIRAGNAES